MRSFVVTFSAFSIYVLATVLLLVLLLVSDHQCHGFLQPLASFASSPIRTAAATTKATSTFIASNSRLSSSSSDEDNNNDNNEGIDLSIDDRLYRIRLPRAPGIEWGTDLSFSFVYVRAMEPTGPASMSGEINVGDQLCELKPVVGDKDADADTAKPVNLIGAPFDFVMNAFASLDKNVKDVDLVFFRGSKDDLKAAASGNASGGSEPESVIITVVENKGSAKELIKKIEAPVGCNVREVLIDNDINVYQSITRWTNCKGKQLCGTCIINVTEGAPNTNRKSMDEDSTLRENPDSYRLSCITFAYGDITVETFPPIQAAQWTR